ncbi:hypothetical protein Daus18300_013351 [Diaporthe australafricana]|uniref:Nephrocystin 3-like N-terminal domain-containing protein n=1 Tax=Diaporthe australafricana TaxID=127596 RepID=A0ABR3VZB3_9PEZI
MADPLSIAASIAGLISLADIAFIRIKKYTKSAKNADQDVRNLSQEVLLLGGALHSLSRLAQAVDTEGIKDQHIDSLRSAGKTVLAGTIIQEALRRNSEDIATAFFFCDYKDARTQKVGNVLSALASQLAIQKEDAYGHLERYYGELRPQRALDRIPDVPGLQRVLGDMMRSFTHVYLVVDGLDECGHDTDNVIDAILNIVDNTDNISTALLSRDEDNIRDRLEKNFTGVEISAHTEDITEYVTSEIEERIRRKSLRIDDLTLKCEIIERLIDGAKGM